MNRDRRDRDQSGVQRDAAQFQAAVQAGDWPRAAMLADRLQAAVPGNAGIAYNRGLVLRRLGQTADAKEAFSRALQLDPQHDKAAFEHAACLMDLGQTAEAADAFQRYADAHPEDLDARLNLANLLIRLGKPDEAIAHGRVAHGGLRSIQSATALATALRDAGQLEACQAVLEDMPTSPETSALRLKIMTQGSRGRFPLRPGQLRAAR